MKTYLSLPHRFQRGSALALTMVMTGIALAILAGALTWSANSARLTHRSIQHTRSVAAAEAATEKVMTRMTRDFMTGANKMVADNVASYRTNIPSSAESAYWNNWEFNDATTAGRIFVQAGSVTNYVLLGSAYSGLRAFVSTYQVAAHARELNALQAVEAGVSQELQLANIPIFQFAMYSSGDMEISCGQPFRITGRVHANATLYVEPDNALSFASDVTAVTDIRFQRHPLDTRGSPNGSAVYERPELKVSPVTALTLPIGTNNTPESIRQIVEPPPTGEDPNSPLARERYYNKVDMVLTVSNSSITATSGRANNFATSIPSSEIATIVTTNNTFRDARENKTVRPIDIDVGLLAEWSRTNSTIGTISSLYVLDRRSHGSTQLGAVRLVNGRVLPVFGLTVATDRPLYVWGHFNQTNSLNLASTNTSSTRPASLVADAVTLLSTAWLDNRSTNSSGGNSAVADRPAAPTTVNAAILTGVVETTYGKYSGGMENFPRFLEDWGSANTLTYNGSMVRMFASRYATNAWGTSGVYNPPRRNWAYDVNFNEPTKLPPLTPSLLRAFRGQWAMLAPGENTVTVTP